MPKGAVIWVQIKLRSSAGRSAICVLRDCCGRGVGSGWGWERMNDVTAWRLMWYGSVSKTYAYWCDSEELVSGRSGWFSVP